MLNILCITFVTVSARTSLVYATTAFLVCILPTLQNHDYGSNEGHQFDSGGGMGAEVGRDGMG